MKTDVFHASDEIGGNPMCFRPAGVTIELVCPECGEDLSEVVNPNTKKCPYCRADLSALRDKVAQVNTQQEAKIPGVAPKAPAAPGAPKAPAAPSAPKPPAAPTV